MWYVDTSPPLLVKIIFFVIALLIIWLVGKLIKNNLDGVSQKKNFEAKNLMKLVVSILQVLVLVILTVLIFEVESGTILNFSALIGTTIGFGLAIVIGNIFAGFYLIGMRPFGIGDFIRVGSTEGIVLEIGLNYTKILQLDTTMVLLPNKTLLDAKLLNCSISMDDLEARRKMGHTIDYDQIREELKVQEKKNYVSKMAQEIAGGTKFTRYPFQLQLKLNIVNPDIPLQLVNQRMDELCDRWEEKLGFRPRYYYGKYIFRQDMQLVLVVSEPMHLIEQQSLFVEDLYVTVFAELNGGQIA